ncbi:hypothetical protein NDU88_003539 [Pleurodeles waltl]|uniref:Uncharacterized protein n=1 Tax=Pleurodeles waltl TaxID=8319 RepID=A0AAV7SFX7_PLEWA|nr:hypothetical protein NDU88_003539 [Pleurodeles waltl]
MADGQLLAGASRNGEDGGQAAPRGLEPGMVTPLRLGPEMMLRGVEIRSCFRPDPAGEGSLPAARRRDQGRRRMPLAASIQMALGQLPAGRSRR